MNYAVAQKWDYLNDDRFHMMEVAKKFKEYA